MQYRVTVTTGKYYTQMNTKSFGTSPTDRLTLGDSLIITDEEVDIIQHSRKSLLFSKGKAWMKKEGAGLFDVAMGSYDGAEICELVGMFALSQLPERYNRSDIGLYRDDGLAVLEGCQEVWQNTPRKT